MLIGAGCRIWDTGFHALDVEKRLSGDTGVSVPIKIKRGAFIGANSTILKGVIIGENSIIGTGSVVTKSVPDNEVWAGNPAKFIRKL